MKSLQLFLAIVLMVFLTACGSKSSKNSSTSYNESESITEDTYTAKKQGYEKGYEDGYNDGYGWFEHGVHYDASNNYQTYDGQNAYQNGYNEGYNEGYEIGEDEQRTEREKAKMRDWHNWEDEDVDALYVYMEGVEEDDDAEYAADKFYGTSNYIRVGWKYFAEAKQSWGQYEVTLGEKVSNNLFKIYGSNIYIHFKWGLPDVDSGDEGVLDWSGSFSSFYKKPDNL